MFRHAEVVSVHYKDDVKQNLYHIRCKLISDTSDVETNTITARPLDLNQLRIPVRGEIVRLIRCLSSYADSTSKSSEWYYIGSINIQNSVHQNSLQKISKSNTISNSIHNLNSYETVVSGNSNVESNSSLGLTFEDNSISPLQIYEGDYVIQGRHGTSIRMSSTVTKGTSQYSVQPLWAAGDSKNGDPLIIVSLNGNRSTEGFTLEDINDDPTSMYLTSGQSLSLNVSSKKFKAADSEQVVSFRKDNLSGNQFVVASDRILLNSKAKEIVLIGGDGISLSSDKSITIDTGKNFVVDGRKFFLGEGATEPILFGDKTGTWLSDLTTLLTSLITAIETMTHATAVGPSSPPINIAAFTKIKTVDVVKLKGKINSLKSRKSFTV